jgi:hypothetical protein
MTAKPTDIFLNIYTPVETVGNLGTIELIDEVN